MTDTLPPGKKSERRYRLRADVRYRVVGGQAVIIVQEAGEAVVLNEVGTRVLELIDRRLDTGRIVADLCEVFEVERDRASSDLDGYLGDLLEAGVIEDDDADEPG